MYIEQTYNCQDTAQTKEIQNLADNKDMKPEEKIEQLQELTGNPAQIGIADVEAASDVLESIGIDDDFEEVKNKMIDQELTEGILESVSNLVMTDLRIPNDKAAVQSASKKSGSVVNQVVNAAKMTTTKNTVIASPHVAVIDVKKEVKEDNAPNKAGLVTFTLPQEGQSGKNLQNCTIGSAEEKENTILMIETKQGDENDQMDMTVVLISEPTLMPDTHVTDIERDEEENDKDIVENILVELVNELKNSSSAGNKDQVAFVNSLVVEVQVKNAPEEFELNIFLKPYINIGSTSTSIVTEPSGKRVQVAYICSSYDLEKARWVEDCKTIYNTANPASGVLCLCSHNTSFAVLMSAKEINPGYSNVQSYLTYTLLGVSVAGLFLTLMLLVPIKEIRSIRSVKINICLSTALLLASSLFLFQDTLINIQDTGLIKLKSTGCALYAMLQHYLWLVVFVWMVIEGIQMYLSLVQVFGNHISKYMLKYNTAAWGLPIPLPLIGYFVFTQKHTVGNFTFTDHGYLANTMCFIRANSIAFFTLFMAPIIMAILLNLVFFALLIKVIRESKSAGNISDQERILRQLKSAAGVMTLLGTGWIVGIFMSLPEPNIQLSLQYVFILLNSTQGSAVFLFNVVLNDQVRSHWLARLRPQQEQTSTVTSTATTSAATRSPASRSPVVISPSEVNIGLEEITPADIEENSTGDQEFPAKKSKNVKI